MVSKINEILLGKRKFYFGIILVITGIVIEYTKGLSTNMLGLLLGIGGLIITGNLISKKIGK